MHFNDRIVNNEHPLKSGPRVLATDTNLLCHEVRYERSVLFYVINFTRPGLLFTPKVRVLSHRSGLKSRIPFTSALQSKVWV
jgi:hypothetical protein